MTVGFARAMIPTEVSMTTRIHTSMNPPSPLLDPVTDQDHAIGPADAPITIVEYGDYECPDCLNFVPIAREIYRAMGGKLRFVFRHFPRNSIHPHASAAAEVAEAAGEQGKFWEMHECFFTTRRSFRRSILATWR